VNKLLLSFILVFIFINDNNARIKLTYFQLDAVLDTSPGFVYFKFSGLSLLHIFCFYKLNDDLEKPSRIKLEVFE